MGHGIRTPMNGQRPHTYLTWQRFLLGHGPAIAQ